MANTLTYPIHELGLSQDDWSHYDAIREAGNANDLTAILKLRDSLPADQFARVGGGEWSAILRFKILQDVFGGQWLSLTTVMAKMKCLFAELAGPNPSAVEAALADVAVLAWADWCRCVQKRETLEDCSIRLASYHDGRVDRAHKRLVRSLRALAAVRKVDLTAIQVNLNGVAGQLGDPASLRAQRAEESLVDEPILAD